MRVTEPSVSASVPVVVATVVVAAADAVRLPSVAERLADVLGGAVLVAEPVRARLPRVAVRDPVVVSDGCTAPIESPLLLVPVALGCTAPMLR